MPSTVVHVAFGLLVAAAVLGPYFDRRALAVVAAAVAFVDLDTVTSLVLESTHRALFHTILIPLFAATYLYAETELSDRSLVRERYGDRGVRVAWATIAAVVVSAIGLDLMNSAGVNVLYPLHNQFYALDGAINYSTREGFQQSFVEFQTATPKNAPGTRPNVRIDVGSKGSTEKYHVGSGINPSKGGEPRDVRRIFPVVFRGWQLWLVLASAIGLTVRARLSPGAATVDPTPTPAEPGDTGRPAVRRVDDDTGGEGDGDGSGGGSGDGSGSGDGDRDVPTDDGRRS